MMSGMLRGLGKRSLLGLCRSCLPTRAAGSDNKYSAFERHELHLAKARLRAPVYKLGSIMLSGSSGVSTIFSSEHLLGAQNYISETDWSLR